MVVGIAPSTYPLLPQPHPPLHCQGPCFRFGQTGGLQGEPPVCTGVGGGISTPEQPAPGFQPPQGRRRWRMSTPEKPAPRDPDFEPPRGSPESSTARGRKTPLYPYTNEHLATLSRESVVPQFGRGPLGGMKRARILACSGSSIGAVSPCPYACTASGALVGLMVQEELSHRFKGGQVSLIKAGDAKEGAARSLSHDHCVAARRLPCLIEIRIEGLRLFPGGQLLFEVLDPVCPAHSSVEPPDPPEEQRHDSLDREPLRQRRPPGREVPLDGGYLGLVDPRNGR